MSNEKRQNIFTTFIMEEQKSFMREGSNMKKYSAGFQICNYINAGGAVQIDWALRSCVDVRTKNANPRGRPYWWPNPYLY